MSACFCTGACRTGGGCAATQQFPGGDGNAKREADAAVSDILKGWDFRKGAGDHIEPSIPGIQPGIFPNVFRQLPKQDEAPGFHPVDGARRCISSEHNFPSMLYVPGGMKYVHYCPSCGQKTTVIGNSVTC
jgi:hypothetical protein